MQKEEKGGKKREGETERKQVTAQPAPYGHPVFK
jgi:hypothetical protein